MDRTTHTTQPIGGATGTVDWATTGPQMLQTLERFLPDLRAEIDKLPVGYKATLINRYDELSGAFETWCQQVGVAPGTFAGGALAGGKATI